MVNGMASSCGNVSQTRNSAEWQGEKLVARMPDRVNDRDKRQIQNHHGGVERNHFNANGNEEGLNQSLYWMEGEICKWRGIARTVVDGMNLTVQPAPVMKQPMRPEKPNVMKKNQR